MKIMRTDNLRIGNYVYGISESSPFRAPIEIPKTIYSIDLLSVKLIDGDPYSPFNKNVIFEKHIKDITGIPLTEDWLKNFGWVSDKPKYYIHPSTMLIELFNISALDNAFILVGGRMGDKGFKATTKEIKYVHELQNVFYLTGEELKIIENTQI